MTDWVLALFCIFTGLIDVIVGTIHDIDELTILGVAVGGLGGGLFGYTFSGWVLDRGRR